MSLLIRSAAAALVAFGLAWGALAWVSPPSGTEGKKRTSPEAPALRVQPPLPGRRLSCRRLTFNGAAAVVATYRFARPPAEVLELVAADLVGRGREGREIGPGRALPAEERRAWQEGRFFVVERLGAGDRLSFRLPDGTLAEICLRPQGEGTAGLWSERQERSWVPDGGDCPGRDPEGLRRPGGWLRVFCADGGEDLLLCYVAPGSPEEALKRFGGRLEEAGWTPDARRLAPDTRVHVRDGRRCLTSAIPAAGETQVSVMITARKHEETR